MHHSIIIYMSQRDLEVVKLLRFLSQIVVLSFLFLSQFVRFKLLVTHNCFRLFDLFNSVLNIYIDLVGCKHRSLVIVNCLELAKYQKQNRNIKKTYSQMTR